MSSRLREQTLQWLRQYWQPMVLGLLGVLLLWQLSSIIGRWWELNQISTLIAEASEPTSTGDDPGPSPPEMPNRDPSKDIFRFEEQRYQLTAIFMDTAIINGQEKKVGERVGEAEVIEINRFDVVIQEDDQENPKTLVMFTSGGRGGGPQGGRFRGSVPERRSRDGGGEDRDESSSEESSSVDDRFAEFRELSWEERRERFMQLSPDERAEFRDALRERFGGGRGFPGGGPPGGGRMGGMGGRGSRGG